jgi:hypothetical protein
VVAQYKPLLTAAAAAAAAACRGVWRDGHSRHLVPPFQALAGLPGCQPVQVVATNIMQPRHWALTV